MRLGKDGYAILGIRAVNCTGNSFEINLENILRQKMKAICV